MRPINVIPHVSNPHQADSRQRGHVVTVLVTALAIAFLAFAAWALAQAMKAPAGVLHTPGVAPPAVEADPSFTRAWSARINLVTQMAPTPGRRGQFFALASKELHLLDAGGARVSSFDAPPKSLRLAADPTGALPYLMVVSSATKWTGFLHTQTTAYFLHALDGGGREVWKKQFDPKEVSAPEPVITRFGGAPVVVLSAGRRILCFDRAGRQLWSLPLWHHAGTLATSSEGWLLAAEAPKRNIVRINSRGEVLGQWGLGDGPSRFRTMRRDGAMFAISARQVFGRGPGVRHALTFFYGGGRVIREIGLPPDSNLVSYATILQADLYGSGSPNWVVPLGDGTLLVYSPTGDEIARYTTGSHIRAALTVPQHDGSDLLVIASDGRLTGWRFKSRR